MSNEKSFMKISVIGIGDSGNRIVDNIYKKDFENINFYYLNSNKKALDKYDLSSSIFINANDLNDANDLIVNHAKINEIKSLLSNTEILILTAGLGGNTGTSVLPVVAKIAKDMGVITIAILTSPFSYEGQTKAEISKRAIEKLNVYADTTIVVSNNRLINNFPDITTADAFKLINNVLKNCIKAFIDFTSRDNVINLTTSDFISSIKNKGKAYIGFGSGMGRNKIMRAINNALNSKIIENSIRNANNIVLSIIGDPTVTIHQINEMIEILKTKVNKEANMSFSFNIDDKLINEIKISVIATFNKEQSISQEQIAINKKLLQDSQEILLEIGNTLDNELNNYSTGEIDLPKIELEEKINNQFEKSNQDEFIITNEESSDEEDIPFFLK